MLIYTISLSGFKNVSSSCTYGCGYTVTYFMSRQWCCCQPQPFWAKFSLRILPFYNYCFQNSQGADRGFPFVLPLLSFFEEQIHFQSKPKETFRGQNKSRITWKEKARKSLTLDILRSGVFKKIYYCVFFSLCETVVPYAHFVVEKGGRS